MTTAARGHHAPEDEQDRGLGVRIARVAGIPVYVAPSWFLIAVVITAIVARPFLGTRPLLGIGIGIAQALVLLVSVLVHEAAHAATARAFGMPVVRIVANLWGGHTSMEAGRTTPGRMALVAAAGPASNAVFAGLAWLALPSATGDVSGRILEGLVIINGSLAVLNILPGMPLDGGQVLECLVWKVTGDRNKGSVVAGWSGRVLAALVVLWFFVRPVATGQQIGFSHIWSLFIASILWTGATESIRRGRALSTIGRLRLGSVMHPAIAVPETAHVAELPATPGGELVVVDAHGRPTAYVDSAHLSSVPPDARPHTPVSAVASQQHPGWVIEADPAGDVMPAVAALQEFQITVGAVVHQGRVVGVVHAADIGRALNG
ncbi:MULTISPECIES: site-2 protease family protein [unclassified Phycicoccus]|uniref:site-2 protease family protein n=1 Tax=unclassified Phycicoccus TaxID=2637926 RepID=UPI0009E677C8|nr:MULTISPECIES: site-2 protease family protein [unclassified Phycicoccus]